MDTSHMAHPPSRVVAPEARTDGRRDGRRIMPNTFAALLACALAAACHATAIEPNGAWVPPVHSPDGLPPHTFVPETGAHSGLPFWQHHEHPMTRGEVEGLPESAKGTTITCIPILKRLRTLEALHLPQRRRLQRTTKPCCVRVQVKVAQVHPSAYEGKAANRQRPASPHRA